MSKCNNTGNRRKLQIEKEIWGKKNGFMGLTNERVWMRSMLWLLVWNNRMQRGRPFVHSFNWHRAKSRREDLARSQNKKQSCHCFHKSVVTFDSQSQLNKSKQKWSHPLKIYLEHAFVCFRRNLAVGKWENCSLAVPVSRKITERDHVLCSRLATILYIYHFWAAAQTHL